MTSHQNKPRNFFYRFTSFFVLIAFAFNNITFAAVQPPVSEVLLPSLADQIQIPESFGEVAERHHSPPHGSAPAPFVVHIQDAHSSREAQDNARKILHHLSGKYGLNLIFLEGGIEKLDGWLLEFFKGPELNQRMAYLLSKDGLAGGVERFMLDDVLSKEPKVSAFGVENGDLYQKNIQTFREVFAREEESGQFLAAVKSLLVTLSSNVFGKELNSFFKEWLLFQENPGTPLSSQFSLLL